MKTVSYFQELLTNLFERSSPTAKKQNDPRSLPELCKALLSERGEVSGHLLACAALDRFESLNEADQLAFFNLLADEFDIDAAAVALAANEYGNTASTESFAKLREVAEPRRQELLRRMNSAPGATPRLVKMRERLLRHIDGQPGLTRADLDFQHLFGSWFNRGFLVLRRIDWNSPASLLEKIIAYEAVHAIDDWDDLRRRLQPADRRCFAFFHPAMPDEPLIFVEVALASHRSESIQHVLSDERESIDPWQATTAIFYSISNCQQGLKGISFGNFLIKQVAQDLAEELPQLRNFITLSPVPGLIRWVNGVMANQSVPPEYDMGALTALQQLSEESTDSEGIEPALDADAQKAALALVAQYFCHAKRSNGMPVDPVARFHLGNGASLDRLIWGADRSKKGLHQSAAIMVNYRYELANIEARHQRYVTQGEVHISKAVRGLLDHATRGARGKRSPGSPDADAREEPLSG